MQRLSFNFDATSQQAVVFGPEDIEGLHGRFTPRQAIDIARAVFAEAKTSPDQPRDRVLFNVSLITGLARTKTASERGGTATTAYFHPARR